MLYGYPLAETINIGPQTVTVPGVRAPRFNVYGLNRMLRRINNDAHYKIKFPNNLKDLPEVLMSRIFAMLVEEKRKKHQELEEEALERKIVKYIQNRLPKYHDKMTADARQATSHEVNPLTFATYYRLLGPVLARHQTGNCGEYSALVVNLALREIQQDRIRVLRGDLGWGNNHVCVVIDAAANADPANYESYGGAALICDAWLDLVAAPTEYARVLRLINCDFEPHTFNSLNDVAA
jgi:hypothetical protein